MSNHVLPPWGEVQEVRRDVLLLIEKRFMGYEGAEKLVAIGIVKPAILAVIYANAALNELKGLDWSDLI